MGRDLVPASDVIAGSEQPYAGVGLKSGLQIDPVFDPFGFVLVEPWQHVCQVFAQL